MLKDEFENLIWIRHLAKYKKYQPRETQQNKKRDHLPKRKRKEIVLVMPSLLISRMIKTIIRGFVGRGISKNVRKCHLQKIVKAQKVGI